MDKTFLSDVETGAEPRSPRKTRLKGPSKARFDAVFRLGRQAKGGVARLIASPGSGLIGVAVSKKIGARPRRNHLKRRFKEAIRSQISTQNLPFDVVVVVNAEADRASLPQIEAELRELFDKVVERWAVE